MVSESVHESWDQSSTADEFGQKMKDFLLHSRIRYVFLVCFHSIFTYLSNSFISGLFQNAPVHSSTSCVTKDYSNQNVDVTNDNLDNVFGLLKDTLPHDIAINHWSDVGESNLLHDASLEKNRDNPAKDVQDKGYNSALQVMMIHHWLILIIHS